MIIGEQATESNFKKYANNYDILHLAMHAVIDNQDPLFSKLVFSTSGDSLEDGLLNTHEIYNMKFNARLAVLSSCSSGEGQLKKGEGVISLARGFSYAGCPSLIMTLWEVEDKTGVDLMVRFYHYLKKGCHKDIALQKAKLDFIKNNPYSFSHPFFWSTYICIGDRSALFFPKSIYLYVVLTVVFSGLVVLFLKRKRMKRNKQ